MKYFVLFLLSIALSACGNSNNNSGLLGGPSYPDGVGVFVETDSGWTRVPNYRYHGLAGSFERVKGLKPIDLPTTENSSKIYFNRVPMNPTQVYWIREVRFFADWRGIQDKVPMNLRPVGEGAYEATIEGMRAGVYNIYVDQGSMGMGHFIKVM